MSNRIWSDEDIKTLEKNYPIRTMKQMQKLLPNYTPRQINRRAKYMNLYKRKEVAVQSRLERSLEERNDLWSDEEKRIIIEYYPRIGAYGVQQKLEKPRSIELIKKIANRMGITQHNKNTKYWHTRNGTIYSEDGQTVIEINIQGGENDE